MGGIFFQFGQMGANVKKWNFFSPIRGNWRQLGANVLVEFENVFLIGGIFYNWGHGCFGANLFLFGGIHVCNFFQFWIGCKFV